jgi:lysine 2,3-aminomutase
MEDWQQILAKSIVKPKDLAERFGLDEKEIEAIVGPYPMRITPTVLETIKSKDDAIWKQVVPEIAELADIEAEDDPLEEDLMSPVPHLVHRYPDRVLLMVTNQCPIYCRFCTRKRLVGKPGFLKKGELDRAIQYLREHTEVRDVILCYSPTISLNASSRPCGPFLTWNSSASDRGSQGRCRNESRPSSARW